MPNIIYGVDTDKEVTPSLVKEAMIKCFTEAHSEVLNDIASIIEIDKPEEIEEYKKINIKMIIKSQFDENNLDYENPTKEGLMKVCDRLAEYVKKFRSPEIIKKHHDQIIKLINLID